MAHRNAHQLFNHCLVYRSLSQAAADAELSEAQRRDLAASTAKQHTGFNAAARQEHLRERQDLAKAHQEEEEAARKFREQIQVGLVLGSGRGEVDWECAGLKGCKDERVGCAGVSPF
jgi:hypothetical protein